MPALRTLEDSIKPLALRNHSTALKAIAMVTQKAVADALGIAPPTLSDWAGDHLERACQVLAAAGLKVVPKADKALPPEEIAAYKILARKAMEMDAPASDFGEFV